MTKHVIGEQLANSLPLFVKGEPYTINDIDQHPDRERIWRTIQEVAYYLTLDLDSDLIYTQEEMDEAEDAAYEDGYVVGKDVGYDEGFSVGYAEGNDDGYEKGYKEGNDDGTN